MSKFRYNYIILCSFIRTNPNTGLPCSGEAQGNCSFESCLRECECEEVSFVCYFYWCIIGVVSGFYWKCLWVLGKQLQSLCKCRNLLRYCAVRLYQNFVIIVLSVFMGRHAVSQEMAQIVWSRFKFLFSIVFYIGNGYCTCDGCQCNAGFSGTFCECNQGSCIQMVRMLDCISVYSHRHHNY